MDLSGLKWPLIILLVLLIGWLLSSGGVNFMIGQFTDAKPGVDAKQDARDETGLTRVASYLFYLHQWEKCAQVLQTSINRYPKGEACLVQPLSARRVP